MAIYSYKAKNISGEQVSGLIEAENAGAAALKLQAREYFPVSISAQKDKLRWGGRLNLRKAGKKDLVIFTRRLADSLKGGLVLARALKILQNQTDNPELLEITKELGRQIQKGKSLSEALRLFPKMFSDMFIAMVEAGETAGIQDVVLQELADFHEKDEELRYRITAALAYPVIMLFIGLLSVIFLLGFVIPKFEIMFQDLGQSIPLPTRILIAASHFLRHSWWLYIPALFLTVLLSLRYGSSGSGKALFSNLKLKLPVIGAFVKKDLISRFIRMLSILLANGIPVLDAINIARNSIDNKVFSDEIDRIYRQVKEGQGLAKPLEHSELFPPFVAEMVTIGEETGNLEASLGSIAGNYEKEVEYALKTMTSLLEPAMILFAGIIVCFIALSMLLPVFQASSGLG
jgi:type II secretory pathway component PulF